MIHPHWYWFIVGGDWHKWNKRRTWNCEVVNYFVSSSRRRWIQKNQSFQETVFVLTQVQTFFFFARHFSPFIYIEWKVLCARQVGSELKNRLNDLVETRSLFRFKMQSISSVFRAVYLAFFVLERGLAVPVRKLNCLVSI